MTLSCMLTLPLVKLSKMLTKYHVKTTHKMLLLFDPDTKQYYVLTPQPISKDPSQLYDPTQIQIAISPINTFPAQDAGIYSQKELNHFWNRVLFTKHSDNPF